MSNSQYPSLIETFWVWLRVAIYSFGGPANQIAVMHKIIVEEKKWVGESRFLHALNYCMLLPGPEAHQLAIYLGWLLHRYLGGLIAGLIFLIPGILAMFILSFLYVKYQSLTLVQTLFFGIKAAVVAIVFDALIRISKRTLKSSIHIVIAISAFIGIFFFKIPFPAIILGAALTGYLLNRYGFNVVEKQDTGDEISLSPHVNNISIKSTVYTVILWLGIWLLPLALVLCYFSTDSIFVKEALLFTKTALVSFGGAYAVLSYISIQTVQNYQWLSAHEMLDGLGMAETLPGPLIKIVQFIGFMAAFRFAENMSPLGAGILGSLITIWLTFVPSFLWIFSGAPYLEKLREIESLQASMTAITAAVVGVILNLSIWFMLHALFHTVHEQQYAVLRIYIPDWQSFDVGTLIIMLAAFIMVFVLRAGIFTVLFCSVLLGFLLSWLL